MERYRNSNSNGPADFISVVFRFFKKEQAAATDVEDANEQRLLRHERFKAGTSERINAIWI